MGWETAPPVSFLEHFYDSSELRANDCDCLPGLSFFKCFTDAEDDAQSCVESRPCLLRNKLRGFVEKRAAFGVA